MKSSYFFRVLLLVIFATACTEKRPQVFSQGQGTNLDSIEDWAPHFVDITTGDVIGTTPTTNAQESVTISPNVKNMNHFDLVELKIEDAKTREIVKNPPFRARPNAPVGVYQLEIKLTDNYLKVYKVAKPEDLPFEEHFYTEETLDDGRIAIPLLGYKIKAYYRIEAQKTNDDQDSHHLMEIEEDDTAKATHVRIDWASRELFQPDKKVDLFPADFFFNITYDEHGKVQQIKPHTWYYAETVTEKSLSDTTTIVGESANRVENSKLNPATKVMFLPREGELRVVNVARDERMDADQIQNGADLNAEATMLLPVQWRDYRTKDEGDAKSLKGEKVEERKWNERKYFEVDFVKLEAASIGNNGRAKDATNRLLDIEIDGNYFSFTILNMDGSNGRKIRYSFLRADNNRLPYVAKRSFKEDRNTFGFFSTIKPFYPNWEYYTERDFNKREYMNRMNPAQKEIVFHLSVDSPKDLEGVTADAIAAWDRAFQQALKGTGREMRIRFSKERTQLGDLRYNTIHLVDTLAEDGLLGFGPSIADPETGEIISATTNVYVNSFQAISAQTVRQYLINRLEKRLTFDGNNLKNNAALADPVLIGAGGGSHPASRAEIALKQLQDVTSKNLKLDDPKLNALLSVDTKIEQQLREAELGNRCSYAENIAGTSSDDEIRRHCPDIEKLVAKYKDADFSSRAAGVDNWNRLWEEGRGVDETGKRNPDKDYILQCSRNITREKLLSTLIHEVGHNFGLRHNFYGSVDKDNFRQVKTQHGETITPQSSSIMEYTVWEEDRLTEAGPYDIAAIRFGYGDTVDLQNNKGSMTVANDKTIAQSLQAKQLSRADLKPYKFCTDEEAAYSFNALCRMHDFGTTPSEIVDYYVDLYQRLQEVRKLRRARPYAGSPESYAVDNISRIFVPLKEIYDQWRYQLGEFARKSNRYLGDLTPKTYADLLANMKNDPVYGPIFAQYYDAKNDKLIADKIYEFFKSVAFGSNQYCLIQEGAGKRAIEFDRLRDMLSEATRGATMIRDCADAAKAAELAQVMGEPAVTVVGETGYPINSYRFEQATTTMESVTDDVIGNRPTRLYAGLMLSLRYANVRNQINRFQPNMIDEPTHFVDLAQTLVSRAVMGVDLEKSGIQNPLPLYEQEGTLYSNIFTVFRTGLLVPNVNGDAWDQNATRTKLGPFTVYSPQPQEDVSSAAAILMMNERPLYVAINQNYFLAYNLINAYNKTDHDLSQKSVSADVAEKLDQRLKDALPAADKIPVLKIKHLVAIYKSFSAIKKDLGDAYVCLRKSSDALTQLDKIFDLLVTDYSKLTSEDQAAVFNEKAAADYVKAGLRQDYKATSENMAQVTPAIKGCIDEQNSKVKSIDKYRKDYNAQKSLILNVLTTFAN